MTARRASLSIVFAMIPSLLAQSQDVDYVRIIIWSMALIGLILLLFAAISYFKKHWMAPQEAESGGFTLADLRALRKQGKMSEEEFEKAKGLILAGYKRAAERQAAATPAVERPIPKLTDLLKRPRGFGIVPGGGDPPPDLKPREPDPPPSLPGDDPPIS